MRPAIAVLVCLVAVAAIVSAVAASTIFGTVAVSATVNIVVPPLPEDIDGDGCVGEKDLAIVTRNLPGPDGSSLEGADVRADVNGDGHVDVEDVSQIGLVFGTRTFGSEPCP